MVVYKGLKKFYKWEAKVFEIDAALKKMSTWAKFRCDSNGLLASLNEGYITLLSLESGYYTYENEETHESLVTPHAELFFISEVVILYTLQRQHAKL